MAYYGGLEGILTGLTKSTDPPSKASCSGAGGFMEGLKDGNNQGIWYPIPPPPRAPKGPSEEPIRTLLPS